MGDARADIEFVGAGLRFRRLADSAPATIIHVTEHVSQQQEAQPKQMHRQMPGLGVQVLVRSPMPFQFLSVL